MNEEHSQEWLCHESKKCRAEAQRYEGSHPQKPQGYIGRRRENQRPHTPNPRMGHPPKQLPTMRLWRPALAAWRL